MHVFISYPHGFEKFAVALDEKLRERKIPTFYNKENVRATEIFRLDTEANIRIANVFVILFGSYASTPSGYFITEMEQIQRECELHLKHVITVLFPPALLTDLPPYFQKHQILIGDENVNLNGKIKELWINRVIQEAKQFNKDKEELKIVKWYWPITKKTFGTTVICILLYTVLSLLSYYEPPVPPIERNPTDDLSDKFNDPSASGVPFKEVREDYKVVLGADGKLKMPGIPGELRIWIGDPRVDPRLPSNMVQASSILPAIGGTARITPFAPAFEIEPKQSICMAIHSTGSATRFKLTPTKIGLFNVGADVQLFNSQNCDGTPVPKWTDTLQVTVVVNSDQAFEERTNQLGSILWEKFLDFWGLSIALFFALLLFLIRGRLKKWFSFGRDK
ncbi:MAG: toll/interleukin-1 receptor domain-containing protein [Nitrosospira sp.]